MNIMPKLNCLIGMFTPEDSEKLTWCLHIFGEEAVGGGQRRVTLTML